MWCGTSAGRAGIRRTRLRWRAGAGTRRAPSASQDGAQLRGLWQPRRETVDQVKLALRLAAAIQHGVGAGQAQSIGDGQRLELHRCFKQMQRLLPLTLAEQQRPQGIVRVGVAGVAADAFLEGDPCVVQLIEQLIDGADAREEPRQRAIQLGGAPQLGQRRARQFLPAL